MRAELLRTEGAVDPGRDQVDVRDARPAGLDRLGRKRPPSFEDREGGHHGQLHARVGEYLLDRVQAALEHQRVEGGLGEQQVHAPFDERLNLLAVGRHHLVEGDVAVARIGHVARDRELLVGRPDRTCHEPRLIGRLRRRGVGRLPGQLRGHEIHLPRVLLEPEIGQRHARGPERVGLDDVGACREVGGVNATDRLPLRERQHVDAVLEVAVVTRESLAAKTSLVERQGMHHGAHGAVEDRDAIFEDGAEKIGTGRGCGSRHRRSGWLEKGVNGGESADCRHRRIIGDRGVGAYCDACMARFASPEMRAGKRPSPDDGPLKGHAGGRRCTPEDSR